MNKQIFLFLFSLIFLFGFIGSVSAIDLNTLNVTYFFDVTDYAHMSLQPIGSLMFNSQGTKMYVAFPNSDLAGLTAPNNITEFTLGTPWDISTASFSNFVIINNTFNILDMAFDTSGELFFDADTYGVIGTSSSASLRTFDLNPPYSPVTSIIALNDTITRSYFTWSPDGLTYLSTANGVFMYKTSYQWNYNQSVLTDSFSKTGIRDSYFIEGGTQLLITSSDISGANGINGIYLYDLPTPYSITGAVNTQNWTNGYVAPVGIYVNEDINKIYLTNWDLGTATGTNTSFYVVELSYAESSSGGTSQASRGSIGTLVDLIEGIFPDADGLTTGQQLIYVFITFILVDLAVIFLSVALHINTSGGKPNMFIGQGALWVCVFLDIILFFYFISISYIPIGLFVFLIVMGLVFLFVKQVLNRGSNSA